MSLHKKIHLKPIDEPLDSSDSNEAIKFPRRSERNLSSSSNDPRHGSKYVIENELSDGESVNSNSSNEMKSSKKVIKSRRNYLKTEQDGTYESDQPRCLTRNEKLLFRSQNLKRKIESNKSNFSVQNAPKKRSTSSIKVRLYNLIASF